ncbi:MAG: DUF502 domain-containing protein, partial [Planctomycetota bacterium]|nr:DUF502 domain-containing protein [Planctomycetota bacterium]
VERQRPFRQAILRGLGVVLPPLLTIALFFWAWSLVESYVLGPVDWATRTLVVTAIADISDTKTETAVKEVGGKYIPLDIYNAVQASPGDVDLMLKLDLKQASANEIYHRYVRLVYLQPWAVIIIFIILFAISLYFIGEVLAARVGRGMFNLFEKIINRIPLIRNVYSSVKQVTDFIVGDREQEMEFNQVVAVQYPSQGIWSIGFVTGTTLRTLHEEHGEPFVSVLMPTSPMPATGFTISVPVSQTVSLNITMDQAIQFVVSCGVVVPRSQVVGEGNVTIEESAIVKQVVEGHIEQTEQDEAVEQADADVAESDHDE